MALRLSLARRYGLLLTLTALMGCAARRPMRLAADIPAIQITTRTNYYTVDLSDPRTLSRAMWDQGLAGSSGVVGTASPRYRWSFVAASTENGCVIQSLRAEGEVTITLPRWSAPTGTSSDRRLWWQSYASAIAQHENTHVRIFEDYLREMVRTVEGTRAVSCTQARDRARSMLDRGSEAMVRRQTEFDRSDGTITIGPPPP